jgi:hypothetical protein
MLGNAACILSRDNPNLPATDSETPPITGFQAALACIRISQLYMLTRRTVDAQEDLATPKKEICFLADGSHLEAG